MPDSIRRASVERVRTKLDDVLRRLAARVGNRKAAIAHFAREIGTGTAALETLLYHRRAGRGLLIAIERAWARTLVRALRHDLEALAHELEMAPDDGLAELAREVEAAVAALEEALARSAARAEEMTEG